MAARKHFDSFVAKEHTPEKVHERVKKLRERNPAAVLLGTYGAKVRYAETKRDEVPEGKQVDKERAADHNKDPRAKASKG